LAAKVLAAVNDKRTAASLQPLTFADDRGCREHAEYLARNWPDNPSLDPHSQDEKLAGATSSGAATAAESSVARRAPLDAVNAWLAAPLHQSLLLHPDRKTLAFGFAHHESGDWVTVLDWRGGGVAEKADEAVLYPAPGQTGVPLAFTGNEIPDPLP